MRRVKSRNFILAVCGVLITLLLGFVVAKTIVLVLDDMSDSNQTEDVQKNILSSSSKIKLTGKGNFIDKTPMVEKTTVSDVNVRLSEKYDGVYYSISFCNMNEKNIRYDDLVVGAVSCINSLAKDDCSNVEIDSYLLRGKNRLQLNETISANSCVDLVVETSYVGNVSDSVDVSISEISLKLVLD